MAAKWRLEKKGEKMGAARVCSRVYETLDDFAEEVLAGDWGYDSPLRALDELRDRLMKALPFDPEES